MGDEVIFGYVWLGGGEGGVDEGCGGANHPPKNVDWLTRPLPKALMRPYESLGNT